MLVPSESLPVSRQVPAWTRLGEESAARLPVSALACPPVPGPGPVPLAVPALRLSVFLTEILRLRLPVTPEDSESASSRAGQLPHWQPEWARGFQGAEHSSESSRFPGPPAARVPFMIPSRTPELESLWS